MTAYNERIVSPQVSMLSQPGEFGRYVLLDRDGVVNVERGDYTTTVSEWLWAPGALAGLKLLTEENIGAVLITNQACIAKGFQTEDSLAALHGFMREGIETAGGRLAAIYHCPHQTSDGCGCRKPEPGMILQAAADLRFVLPETFFIGDTARDMEAARRAGTRSILLVNDWNAWQPKGSVEAEFTTTDLYEAARIVIRETA